MCGIAGIVDFARSTAGEELGRDVSAMARAIRHRGPDDHGAWVDAERGVALGFSRLAIIDLSPAGKQPMISHDGRWAIVFNGEIYNHAQLREELERPWRGHSDTETLLEAVSEWGPEAALRRFNGMFALALWDRRERALHLATDRLGKKPLYYGRFGETLLFGSELKALAAHPAFRGEVDRDALTLFLRYKYVPSPYSIFKNGSKVPPATLLTIDGALDPDREPISRRYWDFDEIARNGVESPLEASEQEIQDELDARLRDSVGLRMIADVPLGAFLSGGIDSSLVVALMQAQSSRPVRTFSIGFHDEAFNEAEYAKAVARHLGTEHTELYVSPDEARAVIPRLGAIYDEPFADSSQIPTFLISELSRRHVTVALSGDGGDELFGGYTRYAGFARNHQRLASLSAPGRRLTAGVLRRLPRSLGNGMVAGLLWRLLPRGLAMRIASGSAAEIAELLSRNQPEQIYRLMMTSWNQPDRLVLGAKEPPFAPFDEPHPRFRDSLTAEVMHLDTLSYLPYDILTKVDRASMGVSLEVRCPLLDYRIVELAWKIPVPFKVRDGSGKIPLRALLDGYVPRELIERPKKGFGVPIGAWLRGPLKEWAQELLDPARLRREGYLEPRTIERTWNEHLSGRADWSDRLWVVLMFQSWLESPACGCSS